MHLLLELHSIYLTFLKCYVAAKNHWTSNDVCLGNSVDFLFCKEG